jgi:hypothetical protein
MRLKYFLLSTHANRNLLECNRQEHNKSRQAWVPERENQVPEEEPGIRRVAQDAIRTIADNNLFLGYLEIIAEGYRQEDMGVAS